MTTWKSFLSWKLRTPFLIIDKSLLRGDSTWWPLKELKELIWQPSFYDKMAHLDDHLKEFHVFLIRAKSLLWGYSPWWPTEGAKGALMWQPTFYAKMTPLDDHLKEFFVLKVEDSLLDHSQVSTPRWLTLTTTWKSAFFLEAEDPLLDHS